jgi:PAS domain S-box-containing protein
MAAVEGDEVGDVAESRDVHVVIERLIGEIRAMTAAIRENRLDHRADVGAVGGIWSELLVGINDAMAAFAGRRWQPERDPEDFFTLSPDLLFILSSDGYFTRVNPAVETTLGYTAEELLATPWVEVIHPDDRVRYREAVELLARGQPVCHLEIRSVGRDGSTRWLEWNCRAVLHEGLIYAAARDVTDSYCAAEEQAALRRVATLVARGASPAKVFDAVAFEMRHLLNADSARIWRYEPDSTVTLVAISGPDGGAAVGTRLTAEGQNLAAMVRSTGHLVQTSFDDAAGSVAAWLRKDGIRSGVGTPILVEGHLWGVIAAVWKRQRQLSSDTQARIAQFTELVATAIANAENRAELTASRARVIAASDETRRRIERDLHDGAQQRLVSVALSLQSVDWAIPPELDGLHGQLANIVSELQGVLDDLRELSRGIHPAILSEDGLGPALKTLARRAPLPVELNIHTPAARPPERIEVAAYYVVAELLTNAAKYAQASEVHVDLQALGDVVRVHIRDDGIGGADPARGSGLIGLRDRVEALGGSMMLASPSGEGTSVLVDFPITTE